MLALIVTALLSASAHLLGAGAVAVEPVPPEVTAVVLPGPGGAGVTGGADVVPTPAVVDHGPAASCAGTTVPEPSVAPDCLADLGSADDATVRAWADGLDPVGDDASALVTGLGELVDPEGTAAWWATLPPERQALLTDVAPGVVGNLDGLPYAVRDGANRAALSRAVLALGARAGTPDAGADDAGRVLMLQQVLVALQDSTAGAGERGLLALDTVLPGRAAVVVGDLQHADDVTVLVPGMLFTVTGQLVDWSETAGHLQDEQRRWASRLDGGEAADTVAVVAWMGYRTPDLSNFYTLDLARTGADHLERTLDGLAASRRGDAARVTVVAHSYGSSTAMLALSTHRVTVDSLVLLGSPGSAVAGARDLAVRGHDVYAGAASFDPVAGSAFFGPDPGAGAFGAVVLHTGGATDPVTRVRLGAALGHNDYLRPGTETLRDAALVGLGRGDLVDGHGRTPGTPPPSTPGLGLVRPQDLWLRD